MTGFEPGIVNPAASGQCESRALKWIVVEPQFKHGRDIRAPVTIELAKLNASRRVQAQFGCHLIIEAEVHLLERLVRSGIIHPVIPKRAPYADGHLWQPPIIKVKAARNGVVTNVIWVEVGVRIKLALQVEFTSQIIFRPRPGIEDVHACRRTRVEVRPQPSGVDEAIEICRLKEYHILGKT